MALYLLCFSSDRSYSIKNDIGRQRAPRKLISLADPFTEEKTGHSMLRKLANPSCAVLFRSLREGKLFLAEAPAQGPDDASLSGRRSTPRREHFWLCGPCS